MIIGTGIDIVNTKRFSNWKDDEKLLSRFFHPNEVKYFYSLASRKEEAIASRFAAKEAFGKALGTGLQGFSLKDVCVKTDSLGKPYLEVSPIIFQITKTNNNVKIHLSISHEKEYAIAMVILEI